ncbi:MAG: hypothetical protein QXH27_04880 [Candidatus Micrarchaeia archaeon]
MLSALCILLVLYDVAKAVAAYFTTEFGVTNKRVLVKMGVLRRSPLKSSCLTWKA